MFQYAADAQDKHWLAEKQHMRATGGKMVNFLGLFLCNSILNIYDFFFFFGRMVMPASESCASFKRLTY